jgi:transcriptional regulator of acetoin/glycerol metabolism
MITRSEFREDLYYRLNGLVVKLPALRERIDFEVVTRKILNTLCENGLQIRVSEPVMDMFKRYPWPGNIRQLHNLLRTAVAMVGCEGEIRPEHLPDDFLDELALAQSPANAQDIGPLTGPTWPHHEPDSPPPGAQASTDTSTADPRQRLQDVALAAMAQMLRLHNGNVSAAAKALGVSRNTIYRKKDLLPPDLLR